jgi:murein L,D-transpeptidase YafK
VLAKTLIRTSLSALRARQRSIRQALLSLIALAFPVALAQDKPVAATPLIANAVEAALVRTFEQLAQQRIKGALSEIDDTLEKNPNFRLGHLIKGDLLMARAGTPMAFADKQIVPDTTATDQLRHEARVRLERYFDAPPAGYLPSSLLHIPAESRHVLLVDSERHRLFVFRNVRGRPEHVVDFYISNGKNGDEKSREGDQRTPLGVYNVTSSVPRQRLPDFYGPGAYPINYPNDWDKQNGRNGSGIWLHGTPSATYSRPPRASDGCVVLTNDDFEKLGRYVDIGATPVVITSKVEWLEPQRWEAEKRLFETSVQQWRADWESRDVERYLSHYSPRFKVDGKDYDSWAQRKRGVAGGKQYVKIGIEMQSAFAFKGGNGSEPYVVLTYVQDYRSNNLNNKMKKRQYWSKEKGRWKIVYENAA